MPRPRAAEQTDPIATRVTESERAVIERAAELRGQSVARFMRCTIVADAERVLADHDRATANPFAEINEVSA